MADRAVLLASRNRKLPAQRAVQNGDAAWAYVYRDGNTFCRWQTFDTGCGSGHNGAWTNYVSAAETAVANLKVTLGNAGTGLCLDAKSGQAQNRGTGLSGGCGWNWPRGLLASREAD